MRILIILLFISFNSFGQTYDDLMSINDLNSFKRVMIENNYRLFDSYKEDDVLRIESYTSTGGLKSASYFLLTEFFYFFINKSDLIETETLYDKIYSQVKNKCEYVGIHTSNRDYACYECKDAKFKGVLGFALTQRMAYIQQILDFKKD